MDRSRAVMLGKLIKSKQHTMKEKEDIITTWIDAERGKIMQSIDQIVYLNNRLREVYGGR